MRVILKKDIPKIGKRGEVKEINDGYARNFLIPKKFAKDASLHNEQQKHEERKEEEVKKTSALFTKINNFKLKFSVKTHDNGALYGSISSSEIEEKLAEQGINVSKKNIELEKPLRKIGSYRVDIKLSSTLKPVLLIEITKEK